MPADLEAALLPVTSTPSRNWCKARRIEVSGTARGGTGAGRGGRADRLPAAAGVPLSPRKGRRVRPRNRTRRGGVAGRGLTRQRGYSGQATDCAPIFSLPCPDARPSAGTDRTPLSGDYDVLICGASFAGLAVARELAGAARADGSPARVLMIDRYEIGERQTSACGIPTDLARGARVDGLAPPDLPRAARLHPARDPSLAAPVDLLHLRLPRAVRAAARPVGLRVRDRKGRTVVPATRSTPIAGT
ncbi:MAG: hypothetical protein WKF40_09190 [Thermoleophilaceae bacterium]